MQEIFYQKEYWSLVKFRYWDVHRHDVTNHSTAVRIMRYWIWLQFNGRLDISHFPNSQEL